MPFKPTRKVWIISALVLVGLAAYLVLLPIVASTRVVKERVAFELSVWSGYQVELDQDPAIKLFPFRAVLSGVNLKEWNGDGPPVLTADQVIFELSPIAALFNDVSFSGIRLMKPTLRVERTPQGVLLPRLPGGGRMANAVKDAQLLTVASSSDTDADPLPGDPFGKVEFSNARVIDTDDDSEILTGGNGVLSWPSLDQSGSVYASGTWRGANVSLTASSENPMLLLAGGRSQFEFSFSGPSGSASFTGSAKFSGAPYLDGEATVSTTSMKALMDWARADIGPMPEVEAVTMHGTVQADETRIKLDGLTLTLDGNTGTGLIEVLLNQPRYAVSGTLDFDAIDLNSFAAVFDPIGESRDVGQANLGLTRRLDLDLRLSARQASVGPVQLSDLAATAQTREGFAVFDISDAQALGGRVQAGMRFSAAAQGTNIDANFGGSDIDGGQLGKVAGMTRILPQSRGNVSVTMKGPVQSWNTFVNRLDGKVAANFGAGPISNLDLAKLRAQIAKGKVFSLDNAGNASTSVDAFKLNAAVANNLATLKDTSIKAGDSLIQLDGVVSFEGRGLALNGTLSDARAEGGTAPSAGFRVGGTWSEPFVTPLPAQAAPD